MVRGVRLYWIVTAVTLALTVFSCGPSKSRELVIKPDLQGLRGEFTIEGKVVSINRSSDYFVIGIMVENDFLKVLGKIKPPPNCSDFIIGRIYTMDIKLLMRSQRQTGPDTKKLTQGTAVSYDLIMDNGSFVTLEYGYDIYKLMRSGGICINE